MDMIELRAVAETRTGRRKRNEDAFELDAGLGLFVVADGMGGYEAGDVASQRAVEVIHTFMEESDVELTKASLEAVDSDQSLDEQIVQEAVKEADRVIAAESREQAARMGTTVVVVAQRGEFAVIGHVGDSRVYRLRDGRLEQMTSDHSFASEVEGAGLAEPLSDVMESYQHFITRALGAFSSQETDPDLERVELREGDRFLLCSDGVHDTLEDATLERLLAEFDRDTAPAEIVDTAFDYGSTDNITAAVVDAVPAEAD